MLRIICLAVGFIFLCTSCVEMLPDQFAPNDVKQDQIFSIDKIIQSKCYIKTLEPIEASSVVSQAQQIILENNQSDSVVFNSQSSLTPPVINNLPIVKYEVKGNSFCKTLLNQKEMRLAARPYSNYELLFQITGSHLRVLIAGALHELPYQNLSQAIAISNNQYAIPVGGYSLQQGQIRNRMNVDNQKTHILDFFPNEKPMEIVQNHTGIPQKIREEANEIYIPELSSGFSVFKYQEKPDVLPKSYFEGVWYSGVSLVSTKALARRRVLGSGVVFSGDSYSGGTPGQKVSFQFESGRMKAINENYKKQGDHLDHPAEAEVLSIPVQHFDYRNTVEASSVDDGLEEPWSNELSWENKRYVSLNFSQVQDFYRKRFRTVVRRYLNNSLEGGEGIFNVDPSVTVKEIRFAPDYFDFVIDDGGREYRFSFLRKDPSKRFTYQAKTIAKTDPNFEFFNLQYNRIFTDPVKSFRVDYEDQVRLQRVHPNEEGFVPLYFSTFTPQDDLIRSIGREAVSLWNQALSMAGVSWKLYLDETKDVNIGDNRYHILNMPNERNTLYSGLSQSYVDDETGEVIATASNVIISDVEEKLEQIVIGYAYEEYNLLNPLRRTSISYPVSMGASFLFPKTQKNSLSYSVENLHYLLFKNSISQFSEMSFSRAPRSLNEARSYFTQMAQVGSSFNIPASKLLTSHEALSPELRDWLRDFKIAYALKQGRFMEEDSFERIQDNIKSWESGHYFFEQNSRLTAYLKLICHDIESPVSNREAFEMSVKRCVQRIYPLYALGLTVHELGHSLFSLRHNFAASADYSISKGMDYQLKYLTPYLTYEDEKGEEKRLDSHLRNDISSSVMDYIRLSDGEQWAPGAYDIEAIRFLFDGAPNRRQAPELRPIDFLSFRYRKDKKPASQDFIPINFLGSRYRKDFKRCSDGDVGSSAYCLRHDLGSTPDEIAVNEVTSLFYTMDQYFYNQDRTISDNSFYASIFRNIWNLMVIYQDWRRRLDNYSRRHFNDTIEHLNESQRGELYFKFETSLEERELLSFYKARNLIYHTLTYLAFLPNRYCMLEKDWSSYKAKRWKPNSFILIELSKVISEEYSFSGKRPIDPIFSCLAEKKKEWERPKPHPALARYIETHYPGYFLNREMGHFLYPDPLPTNIPYKEIRGRPYKGTALIRIMAFGALTLTKKFFPVPIENNVEGLSMMNEKDIRKGLERLWLARVTRGVFYPTVEFFESFDSYDLEHLSPESSAYKLFNFPFINGEVDPLFRDEFIQPQQLTSDYEGSPQSRTDTDTYRKKRFYQNFSEEKGLLHLFSNMYSAAYAVSEGLSIDSISERRTEAASGVQIAHPRTAKLLADKATEYGMYRHSPYLSTLYYFESSDFLVLPKTPISVDSFGNRILSELAKNSARLLWTKPYKTSFEGENLYTSSGFSDGFGNLLYNYLGGLLDRFQGTRLGRFYFMYAYLLALSMLDGYEQAMPLAKESLRKFHEEAMSASRLLEQNVLFLFGFASCNGPKLFEDFYHNLENNIHIKFETHTNDQGMEYTKWVPSGAFQSASDRLAYHRGFEQWLFENCSGDPMQKGKMHRLFLQEGYLLNYLRSFGLGNFALGSPYVELPSFFHVVWEDRLDAPTERFQNRMLLREVRNIENQLGTKGGINGVHTLMKVLFQKAFPPFFEDEHSMTQWIRSNRQMLIDIIPKLMLMYSEDRDFVGEFMFLSAMIYNSCVGGQVSSRQCLLTIEKFIGHYFRGSDYGSDPKLEFYFNLLFNRSDMRIPDGGIPWSVLLNKEPREYGDRDVDSLALDMEVISDYLFYERGWDTMSASSEELMAQRDLLFTILPLGNLRLLSSSNFALSQRINLSRFMDESFSSALQEFEGRGYDPVEQLIKESD